MAAIQETRKLVLESIEITPIGAFKPITLPASHQVTQVIITAANRNGTYNHVSSDFPTGIIRVVTYRDRIGHPVAFSFEDFDTLGRPHQITENATYNP